jgi:hypothetical protein
VAGTPRLSRTFFTDCHLRIAIRGGETVLPMHAEQ